MKKLHLLLVMIFMIFGIFVFSACSSSENKPNEYTISFVMNSNEEYTTIKTSGKEKLVFPRDPALTGYTFDGWFYDKDTFNNEFLEDSLVSNPITTNLSVYAKFTKIEEQTYTIIWENYDGSILQKDENVLHGQIPTYNGSTPIKPSDNIYFYTFIGWSPAIEIATNNTTYVAQYSQDYLVDYIYENINDKCFITKYVGKDTNVSIPSQYNNLPVVSIGENAFTDSDISSIYIPSSIISIEKGAFFNCSKLKELTIPILGNGIDKTFLGYIFGAEDHLQNNTYIPKTLTKVSIYNTQNISANSFYNCSWINEIYVSDDILNIDQSSFYGCSSLSKITLPFVGDIKNSNKTFGWVFGTSNYSGACVVNQNSQNYFIPTSLKTVVINCGAIKQGAFENCSMIEDLYIGDGVDIIQSISCNNLKNLNISSSVKVNEFALAECISLQNLTVSIQDYSYKDSQYNWTMYHVGRMFSKNIFTNSKKIVQSKKGVGYGSNSGGGSGGSETYYIPTTLQIINLDCKNGILGYAALQNFYGIDINLSNFTSFGDYCLSGCGIKSVTISSFIKDISAGTFSNCIDLETVVISSGVETIGSGAFLGCSKLNSITLPKTITSIGESAFKNCISLKSIDFLKNVEANLVLKQYVFYGCSGFENLTIPSNVKSIQYGAFIGCSNLISIDFEDNSICSSIGGNAFQDCINLETIIIPLSFSNVRYAMGENVFAHCFKLNIFINFLENEATQWYSSWNSGRPIYWSSEWDYNDNNVPIPLT